MRSSLDILRIITSTGSSVLKLFYFVVYFSKLCIESDGGLDAGVIKQYILVFCQLKCTFQQMVLPNLLPEVFSLSRWGAQLLQLYNSFSFSVSRRANIAVCM